MPEYHPAEKNPLEAGYRPEDLRSFLVCTGCRKRVFRVVTFEPDTELRQAGWEIRVWPGPKNSGVSPTTCVFCPMCKSNVSWGWVHGKKAGDEALSIM